MQFIGLQISGQAPNRFDYSNPAVDLVEHAQCILDCPFGQQAIQSVYIIGR
jgi:hypothetical protein